MVRIAVLILLLCAVVINGKPTSIGVEKSISASAHLEDNGGVPVFSVGKGGVGVNFQGFKASAGLGGVLTGDAADGGLRAAAETPFGQAAGAGLGGNVGRSGKSTGGLYAGATAGGGISAGAGLKKTATYSSSLSQSYAGASSSSVHITKIGHKPHGAIGGKFVAVASAPPAQFQKEVEIVEQPAEKPHTTYLERTVIPNYVEKTIQVPSYVEKTIRVPTVVEKRIRVPAAPTVIEKEVEKPAGAVVGGAVKVVEKSYDVPQEQTSFTIHKNLNGGGGYGGGGFGGFGFGGFGGGGGGYEGGYGGRYGEDYGAGYGGGGGAGGGSGHFHIRKTANPQFFNDVFNIPISTLGAVSKLVGGIVGGTSGSLSLSKSYGAY